jgi:hypothetical protein
VLISETWTKQSARFLMPSIDSTVTEGITACIGQPGCFSRMQPLAILPYSQNLISLHLLQPQPPSCLQMAQGRPHSLQVVPQSPQLFELLFILPLYLDRYRQNKNPLIESGCFGRIGDTPEEYRRLCHFCFSIQNINERCLLRRKAFCELIVCGAPPARPKSH